MTAETKGVVDSEAAHLGTHFYALDELSRIQQVRAAMKRALQKFDRIVNENPEDWEEIVSTEVERQRLNK